MPFFEAIDVLPPDPIFSISKLFKEDPHPNKVNLGIGAYQDDEGRPCVLAAIRQAEHLLASRNLNKDYLPIEGYGEFIEETLKLIFDPAWLSQKRSHIAAAQSVGGAGALRLGGELLAAHVSNHISLSYPTWPNHQGIFSEIGFKIDYYPFYDDIKKDVPFGKLCEHLKTLPPSTVVLLQVCCHNPTGLGLTSEQWQELSHLMHQHSLFPFFDLAYQGFDQSLEKDAEAIRIFSRQGLEMMVAYSFSKNMGLYGERVGLIAIVTQDTHSFQRVHSQLLPLIRHNYSNPPMHGAQLASIVLKTPELFNNWRSELSAMRDRIDLMRKGLQEGLMAPPSTADFSYLQRQRGLFAYSGLNTDSVFRLREKYGIYLIENGRLNLAGLNPSNLPYVVESILAVIS